MKKNNHKSFCKICGAVAKPWIKDLFDDRHGYPGLFEIWRCPKCGFGQTLPQLSSKDIAKVYAKYYPRHNFDINTVKKEDYVVKDRDKLWRKGLLTNCQYWVKPNSKVLDVGCGLGFSLLELLSLNCEPFGIDPDKNADKIAKKFKLHFHRGFIEDKPFGKEQFDYILGSQVLEHTNDPLSFLKTVKSRLKLGGQIILSFPNANSLSEKLFGKNWLHWHLPYHLNFFSKKSVEVLADRAGLKIVQIETTTPNMWTNLQLRRLLLTPQVGQKDEFWEGGHPGLEAGISGPKAWLNFYLKKGFLFLENWNLINRFIDNLGWGDSFVVVFERL